MGFADESEGAVADSVVGIVLAAGSGQRFGGPKQFALLGGERLVDRAVRLLAGICDPIVVALPPGVAWDGDPRAVPVPGGATRVASLANALAGCGGTGDIVVVHDAIRPLATVGQLRAVIDAVTAGADGALVVSPMPDTLKRLEDDGTLRHVGREGFVIAQGPFAYRRALLERVIVELGTDLVEESIGVERLGGRVVAVSGDRWSHHLVEQLDLERFERLSGIT